MKEKTENDTWHRTTITMYEHLIRHSLANTSETMVWRRTAGSWKRRKRLQRGLYIRAVEEDQYAGHSEGKIPQRRRSTLSLH